MSLAQLGKGHVTAPAIYLIETGRTRPSLPTLEHIARRTGKPVEFFLAEPAGATDETQTRMLSLEAMVADGRNEDAIALGKWLLDQGASAFRLGRIRLLLARAYLATSQPERAETLLAEARSHFEAVNDGVMLAECVGAQAALATLTHPKDAVALAQRALEVCRGLKPVPTPTESRLLGTLASAHMANREWDAAVEAYKQAIESAGQLLDLRQVARTYSELGVAYHEIGEAETSARFVMRSVALLEVIRDRVSLARSENSLALVQMARGDFTDAREHLERSLDLSDESDLEFGRSHVLLGLCELSMHEGKVDQAAGFAEQALQLAERHEEGASIAEAHVWLGRIADRRGDNDIAEREFEDAIRGFETLGLAERLLHTHGVYAEVLERRGELAKAYVHMKHALHASRPGLLRVPAEEERVNSA
jgi:tetratricopeptide (TPR) repeat protein